MTLLTATKDLEHSQAAVLARWLNSAEDSRADALHNPTEIAT